MGRQVMMEGPRRQPSFILIHMDKLKLDREKSVQCKIPGRDVAALQNLSYLFQGQGNPKTHLWQF